MASEFLDDQFSVLEDDVRQRMFDTIDALFPDPAYRPDKREGQFLWTMTGPPIKEIVEFYSDLNLALNQAFIQYATGTYLDLKGQELALARKVSTPSKGIIRFLGLAGTVIPAGTTSTTTAEDTNDPVYQFDTDTYEQDGVTPVPVGSRTIVGTPDPVAKNEIQRIAMDPNVTAGDFYLEFDGQTTANPISFNGTALNVKSELENLSNVDVGDVDVSGGPFPLVDITVEFRGNLQHADQPLMTIPTNTLVGGSVAVSTDVKGTPATATAVSSGVGEISGSAMWRYTWVTAIGDSREDTYEQGFGETTGSPESAILTLSNEQASVTVEPVPSLSGLNEIKQVRLYRSLNDGGGFGEWKLVATVDADTSAPMVITDNVGNLDFDVITSVLDDTNTTGIVEVAATSIDNGSGTNVAARSIVLLDDVVSGVEKVTNTAVFSGGSDEESDDTYRARLIEEIQKPPGAGNIYDYEGWAKTISGVGGVTVIPEWEVDFGGTNGPGTVKVIISGSNNELVNYDLIEQVRQYISGDIALASPIDYLGDNVADYGVSTSVINSGGNIDAGDYEYVFSFVNVGGGETPHSGVDNTYTEVSSLIIDVSVASNSSQVQLIDIPSGQSGVGVQNTLKRRIYRRNKTNADTRFYLVGTIENNGDTTFTDTVSDASIYPSLTVKNRYAPVINSTSLFNGQAPIGAHVTVESISEFNIKVNATIVPETGYNLLGTGGNLNLGNAIRLSLKNFLDAKVPGSTIYYKDVENAIHDTPGVKDFRDVTLETIDGIVAANVTAPNTTSKPVFDPTGVLIEATI